MDYRRLGQELRQQQQQKQQPQLGGPKAGQPQQPDQKSAEKNATDYREKILSFIRMHGPSLPNEIRHEIGKDNLITSAMLSEMSSNKLVRVSYVKVGGSPLYYIAGQESQLLRFVDHIHKREREALEYLKVEIVVRDEDLEPVQRVAIRELKDFAMPITVTLHDRTELFWKWYLAKNEDISEKVKQLMPKPEVKPEAMPEQPQPAAKPEPPAPEAKPEPKPEPQQPKPEARVPEKKEVQKEPPKPRELAKEHAPGKEIKDRFYQKIRAYCEERGIKIIDATVVRKSAELDLIVQVPSAVGSLTYYAKAKSKKTASDTDLAGALIEAQSRRLPALFLTPGKLAKRAQQKLDRELKGLVVKSI